MTVQTILHPRWIMTLDCISRPTDRLPDLSSPNPEKHYFDKRQASKSRFHLHTPLEQPISESEERQSSRQKGKPSHIPRRPSTFPKKHSATACEKRSRNISFGMHRLCLWAHKAHGAWLAGGRARYTVFLRRRS